MKPSTPQCAQPPCSNPLSEADWEINNTEAHVPKFKKPPRLRFTRSPCLIKDCRTVCSHWWTCLDTRLYASDRSPPDVNPHRNDCVCDPCRERYPQLKGTFSSYAQQVTSRLHKLRLPMLRLQTLRPTLCLPSLPSLRSSTIHLKLSKARPTSPLSTPSMPPHRRPASIHATTSQHVYTASRPMGACLSTAHRLHTSARPCKHSMMNVP